MRIAIFEPEPRVCGPMAWAYHLRDGFRENGHEADVVTFTRSGKARSVWGEGNMRPGIRWWGRSPDVVGRLRDAGYVLDQYDRIVLTDVRTVMQDKEAAKGKSYLDPDTPEYLNVLAATQTPFIFALHGNNYPPSEVPYVKDLLTRPNFLGTAVTHSPTSPNLSRHLWPDVDFTVSPLPYRMQTEPDSHLLAGHATNDVVGITGRYITTKGHHALGMAAALDLMPSADRVQLWGASSLSLAASATYKTFEAMVLGKPLSLPGIRHGVIKPGERTETGGDVIRPYLWEVTAPGGTQIEYKGGYESGFDACRNLDVHVDLTASEFSDGMEYSQFEAIDAGCMQVSVSSMWSDDFEGRALESVPSWPGESKLANQPAWHEVLEGIGEAVEEILTLNTAQRRTIAQRNRTVLATKHAPKAVARTFLTALGAS
jgi:hypothetical protein